MDDLVNGLIVFLSALAVIIVVGLFVREKRPDGQAAQELQERKAYSLAEFVALLVSDDAWVRRGARATLSQRGYNAEALGKWFGRLQESARGSNESRLEELTALYDRGWQRYKQVVLWPTGEYQPEVARKAEGALQEWGDQIVVPWLIRLLTDSAGGVRRGARDCLLRHVLDPRHRDLIEAAANDANDAVCQVAIQALERIGDDAAIEALIQVLRDEAGADRSEVIQALGRLKAGAAVPALANVLAHSATSQYRVAAIQALERIGDDAAIDVLIQALKDEAGAERSTLVEALARLKAGGAVPALAKLMANTSDGTLRSKAVGALAQLVVGISPSWLSPLFDLYVQRPDLRATLAPVLNKGDGARSDLRVAIQPPSPVLVVGEYRTLSMVLANRGKGHARNVQLRLPDGYVVGEKPVELPHIPLLRPGDRLTMNAGVVPSASGSEVPVKWRITFTDSQYPNGGGRGGWKYLPVQKSEGASTTVIQGDVLASGAVKQVQMEGVQIARTEQDEQAIDSMIEFNCPNCGVVSLVDKQPRFCVECGQEVRSDASTGSG